MRHISRLVGLVLCLLPTFAFASDGVIELNDPYALAGDAEIFDPPGYPILIRAPGSYRLTSNLSVPVGTSGIMVQAPQVEIDLNGFTVRGSEDCFPGSCQPSLAGVGILGMPIFGGGVVTVKNGGVSNFGASCIDLAGGRVEDVRVSSCGEHGIHMHSLGAGDPGAVFRCAISDTANSSIVFESGGLYRENTLNRAGLKSPSPTIVGGTATGGNLCDDGRCSRRGARRYYLSQTKLPGNQALTACETGFHMASRWEILDPSAVEYDTVRGALPSHGDMGSGPPSSGLLFTAGWARTGSGPAAGNPLGASNCGAWTSADPTHTGMRLTLNSGWGDPSVPMQDRKPWYLGEAACSDPQPVWCIED